MDSLRLFLLFMQSPIRNVCRFTQVINTVSCPFLNGAMAHKRVWAWLSSKSQTRIIISRRTGAGQEEEWKAVCGVYTVNSQGLFCLLCSYSTEIFNFLQIVTFSSWAVVWQSYFNFQNAVKIYWAVSVGTSLSVFLPLDRSFYRSVCPEGACDALSNPAGSRTKAPSQTIYIGQRSRKALDFPLIYKNSRAPRYFWEGDMR